VILALVLVLCGDEARGGSDAYTRTRYPIVLVHGMAGFDRVFGVIEYFFAIPEALREGGAEVFSAEVSAIASTEQRGEQLLAQVEYITAVTGAAKVNLIGHSQGGLDSRYVMHVRPDLVASVTTVGSPHAGSRMADFLADNIEPGGFAETVLDLLGDSFGILLRLVGGASNEQDAAGALQTVTSAGARRFSTRYPGGIPPAPCDQNGESTWQGIRLYSWTGRRAFTHVLDPTDYAFVVAKQFTGRQSDGLVDPCSARFGELLGKRYRMNHLDEVNQISGLVFRSNPRSLFRAHVNRLKNAGL
jgi:triacylglycerol lipase